MVINKLYHVYFDQGGLLGCGTLLVCERKLVINHGREFDISHFYFGCMNLFGLQALLQAHHLAWGVTPKDHKGSLFKVADLIKQSGM